MTDMRSSDDFRIGSCQLRQLPSNFFVVCLKMASTKKKRKNLFHLSGRRILNVPEIWNSLYPAGSNWWTSFLLILRFLFGLVTWKHFEKLSLLLLARFHILYRLDLGNCIPFCNGMYGCSTFGVEVYVIKLNVLQVVNATSEKGTRIIITKAAQLPRPPSKPAFKDRTN
uniref:Uncharacterized protein n=1 Tax=Strigamia maritima TaxID=126957 RepID=T1J164_STRMM